MNRRELLASTVAAASVGAAGCLGNVGSPGGSGGDATETADVIRLESLDVGGSPGGEVPVREPGSVTLLDFFATWCAPCKPQMEGLRTIHERFPGVHAVSITSENDRAAVRQFWVDYEGTWPVALDPDLRATEAFDATRVPTLLVLDPEGTETWRHVGLAATDSIARELREAGAIPSGSGDGEGGDGDGGG